MNLFLFAVVLMVLTAVAAPGLWAQSPDWADYPEPIRKVLANCAPLEHPRGDRLPLLLWPVHGGVVQDDALQERIIRDLDDGVRSAGEHEVVWDGRDAHGRDVRSGVYFYRLMTPAGTAERKAVVLR